MYWPRRTLWVERQKYMGGLGGQQYESRGQMSTPRRRRLPAATGDSCPVDIFEHERWRTPPRQFPIVDRRSRIHFDPFTVGSTFLIARTISQ
jgi:hypothetical protein